MQKSPHMLLEGLIIGSYAAGASRSFIYIRGEYVQQADILDAALAEAREAGYIGERILGSEHSLSLVVHRGAGAYICGEETGLLDSLEGKRGNPRLKPPFPANEGLYKGPTLINNVETLSTVPTIITMGGAEYAKLGTEQSTGTKLVSVSGHVQRPGNYEIELGISSREIIYGLAGGPPPGRSVKCWFPGGSSAPVLTGDELDVPYDFESLAKAGSMLGSGAIIVVDDSTPILELALKTAKFYRHESCGKCTPCREGTNWTVHMLERIDSRRGHPDGPRDHGVRAGAHHRPLPVRAGRCDGDADRLDDREVQRRARSPHGAPPPGTCTRRGRGMTGAHQPHDATTSGRTKVVKSEGPQARSVTDARRAYVSIKSRDRMSRGALHSTRLCDATP